MRVPNTKNCFGATRHSLLPGLSKLLEFNAFGSKILHHNVDPHFVDVLNALDAQRETNEPIFCGVPKALALHIGLPGAAGFVVRVRNAIPESRLDTSYRTFHKRLRKFGDSRAHNMSAPELAKDSTTRRGGAKRMPSIIPGFRQICHQIKSGGSN